MIQESARGMIKNKYGAYIHTQRNLQFRRFICVLALNILLFTRTGHCNSLFLHNVYSVIIVCLKSSTIASSTETTEIYLFNPES